MKLPRRIAELIGELRRRGVLQAAAVYATGAFVVVQAASIVFPALQLPEWSQSLTVIVAISGFPVVLALWWAYEITPDGIRRTVEQEEPVEVIQARGTPWTALFLVTVVTAGSAGVGWVAWDLWLTTEPEAGAPEAMAERRSETLLRPNKIAVLPFETRSQDRKLKQVARGLSDDLTHHLSQIEALDIVSELGTRPFADSNVRADSIARTLNAGILITGTVEELDRQVRLRIQMLDGQSSESLMSSEFTEPRDSVLTLRDNLVEEAVRQLRSRLGQEIELERIRGSTQQVRAWELYHQAENVVQRGDSLRYSGVTNLAGQFYDRADSLYREARQIDQEWLAPEIALGWLAYKRARLGGPTISSVDRDWLLKGVSIAEKLLSQSRFNPAAHELRGVLRSWLSRTEGIDSVQALRQGAEEDLRAAVTQEPDRARAWVELAEVLRQQGRFDDARSAWRQAREADAFLRNNRDILQLGAHLALEFGEPKTALEWAERGQRRLPDSALFPQIRLLAYPMDGAPLVSADRVWEVLQEFEKRVGAEQPYARIWVAASLARFGLEDSAKSVLDRALDNIDEKNRRIAEYYVPKVWLNMGDTVRAVDMLRELVRQYEYWQGRKDYIARDSWWQPLHGDSAFRAIVSGE